MHEAGTVRVTFATDKGHMPINRPANPLSILDKTDMKNVSHGPEYDNFGQVLSLGGGKESQTSALALVKAAGFNDSLAVYAYTFDLEPLCKELILAHGRRAYVTVYMDEDYTRKWRSQVEASKEMLHGNQDLHGHRSSCA